MDNYLHCYYVVSRQFGAYALQPPDLKDTKRYHSAFTHEDSEHAIVLFSTYDGAALASESWPDSIIVPIEVRGWEHALIRSLPSSNKKE
jgi:hypothetical protein